MENFDQVLAEYGLPPQTATTNEQQTTEKPQFQTDGNAPVESNGLGVDSDDVPVRTRKIYAKLDDSKLLSNYGIPHVQNKIAKKKLFKGKGYEKRDLNKLLTEYQIWAHSLYPKANFNDFIELCKRAGTSSIMRGRRRQWINDEKDGIMGIDLNSSVPTGGGDASGEDGNTGSGAENDNNGRHSTPLPSSSTSRRQIIADDDDEDELFVSPPAHRKNPAEANGNNDEADIPNDDELDELMSSRKKSNDDSDDIPNDDELQEMMGAQQDKSNEFEDEEMRLAQELGF